MNVKNKSLIVFSENYPYEGGEQFFVNDLYYLSGKFSKLYVFPTKEKNKQIIERKPDNLVPLKAISANSNVKNLFSNWRLTLSMLYCEVVLNKKRIYFLKNLKYFLSIFSETIEMENIFQKNLKVEGVVEDDVFLSLWMNKYTLMLSISKYKNHIKDFSFRINGVDIFNERNKGGYLPFERFNYKQSKRVIINSKFSYNYKEKQNLYVDKLDYNYYSIDDYGLNPVNEDNVFHIVSCSNLIPLKRVKLIQEALMFADFKVKWTHFGDGSER
jgi:colanic acid/amylovoran biosynthesis glycosyltransferase